MPSDGPGAASQPRSAAGMKFIMLTVLIDMIGVGLIIPVLPLMVGTFTTSAAEQAWWFGAIALAYGVANFFGSAMLGALSDRVGRRPVLMLGFAALAVSFIASGLVTQLWLLLVVRALGGALQANTAVANAYVADISAPEERAKRFGMLGAMFGVGFILGPAVGGWLGSVDVRLPFFVAGAAALVNLVYGYLALPESLPVAKRRTVAWWWVNPFAALWRMSRLPGIGPLVLVLGLSGLAQFMLHTTWVLYTHFRFGWGPMENGWSMFAVGVASALVQGYLLPKMLKRFGARRLVRMALTSGACAYLAWGLAYEGWMMLAIIGLNLMGFSATVAIQGLVSAAASEHIQGQTMGAVASLNRLTAALAPVVAAPLLALVSHLPASDWRVGTPFFVCALLQGTAAVVAWWHFRRQH